MGSSAENFSDGWERLWKINLSERRAEHLPTGLHVELRRTDDNVWYPFALDAEDWVAKDPARLESFTGLMLQAYALFRETAPETGWLTYAGTDRYLEPPRHS